MEIVNQIFERACPLVRERLVDGGEDRLLEMCSVAFRELTGRLREGICVEDISEDFVPAAALIGTSLFLGVGANGQFRSLSAGSLRVEGISAEDVRKWAESLRKQGELMMTGHLLDNGFSFRTVRS